MITPQTNTTLKDIAQELLKRDNYVICGHVSPDGDCIGSALALKFALEHSGKKVVCTLAKAGSLSVGLSLLPGAWDMVAAEDYDGPVDNVICVDVPNHERLGEAQAGLHKAASFSVTIDHHAADTAISDLTYVDPDAPAAAILIWELAGYLGSQQAPGVAECAYTGLMTDTGRFEYQNTDERAFRAAAEMIACGIDPAVCSQRVFENRTLASVLLEEKLIANLKVDETHQYVLSYLNDADFKSCSATYQDSEPMIELLRSLTGIRVAAILKQNADIVNVSLRAKDHTDVSAIARSFGGGGHVAAAGYKSKKSLEDAIVELEAALRDLLMP